VSDESSDHDQRFKTLIREFFEPFLRLFFPEWAERIDFSTLEWLDKEVYANPPEGSLHHLDLVARVKLKERLSPMPGDDPANLLLAVLIEVESEDRVTRLEPRLPDYYLHLRRAYSIPVLPIALFTNVGKDGIAVGTYAERLGEFTVLTFHYLYVGLRALDAVQYVDGDNLVGVGLSPLMKMRPDEVPLLGARALEKVADSGLNEYQKLLLYGLIEAYLRLEDQEKKQLFEDTLKRDEFEGARGMNKTTFEKGVEQGERNALNEFRKTLRELLEAKFGSLPDTALTAIDNLSREEVRGLIVRSATAASLVELGLI
jgi:hypothetical protein